MAGRTMLSSATRLALARSLAATTLLVAGCQHPENYRWAGTAEFSQDASVVAALDDAKRITKQDWRSPQVAVYAFPAPPKDAPPPLSVKDLSDHGQEAAIWKLTEKGANPDEIRSRLAKPISGGGPGTSLTAKKELYRFDRTLVATVTKGTDARPGDRLLWSWILIKPINFQFAGYTVLATDNATLNIEKVQNQTTATLLGQISATLPGAAAVSPSVSGSISNQYTTSADINQQYERNHVDILPNFLRIYRESERNLDVAGNTLINLTLVADPLKLQNDKRPPSVMVLRGAGPRLARNGKNLLPADAAVDIELIKTPSHCPLTAMVRLVYEIRRITGNPSSYVEGEQRVSIEQHATDWHSVDIVSADDVFPATWQIHDPHRIPVHVETGNRESLPLAFTDYEAARDMAIWMTAEHSSSIGKPGVRLTLGGRPMPAPYPQLTAERVVDSANQAEVCAATVLAN